MQEVIMQLWTPLSQSGMQLQTVKLAPRLHLYVFDFSKAARSSHKYLRWLVWNGLSKTTKLHDFAAEKKLFAFNRAVLGGGEPQIQYVRDILFVK